MGTIIAIAKHPQTLCAYSFWVGGMGMPLTNRQLEFELQIPPSKLKARQQLHFCGESHEKTAWRTIEMVEV